MPNISLLTADQEVVNVPAEKYAEVIKLAPGAVPVVPYEYIDEDGSKQTLNVPYTKRRKFEAAADKLGIKYTAAPDVSQQSEKEYRTLAMPNRGVKDLFNPHGADPSINETQPLPATPAPTAEDRLKLLPPLQKKKIEQHYADVEKARVNEPAVNFQAEPENINPANAKIEPVKVMDTILPALGEQIMRIQKAGQETSEDLVQNVTFALGAEAEGAGGKGSSAFMPWSQDLGKYLEAEKSQGQRVESRGGLDDFAMGLASTMPYLAVGAAGALTGNPLVSAAVFALDGEGYIRQKLRKAGVRPDVEAWAGRLGGLLYSGAEMLPLGLLLRRNPIIAKNVKQLIAKTLGTIAFTTAAESSEEFIQQYAEDGAVLLGRDIDGLLKKKGLQSTAKEWETLNTNALQAFKSSLSPMGALSILSGLNRLKKGIVNKGNKYVPSATNRQIRQGLEDPQINQSQQDEDLLNSFRQSRGLLPIYPGFHDTAPVKPKISIGSNSRGELSPEMIKILQREANKQKGEQQNETPQAPVPESELPFGTAENPVPSIPVPGRTDTPGTTGTGQETKGKKSDYKAELSKQELKSEQMDISNIPENEWTPEQRARWQEIDNILNPKEKKQEEVKIKIKAHIVSSLEHLLGRKEINQQQYDDLLNEYNKKGEFYQQFDAAGYSDDPVMAELNLLRSRIPKPETPPPAPKEEKKEPVKAPAQKDNFEEHIRIRNEAEQKLRPQTPERDPSGHIIPQREIGETISSAGDRNIITRLSSINPEEVAMPTQEGNPVNELGEPLLQPRINSEDATLRTQQVEKIKNNFNAKKITPLSREMEAGSPSGVFNAKGQFVPVSGHGRIRALMEMMANYPAYKEKIAQYHYEAIEEARRIGGNELADEIAKYIKANPKAIFVRDIIMDANTGKMTDVEDLKFIAKETNEQVSLKKTPVEVAATDYGKMIQNNVEITVDDDSGDVDLESIESFGKSLGNDADRNQAGEIDTQKTRMRMQNAMIYGIMGKIPNVGQKVSTAVIERADAYGMTKVINALLPNVGRIFNLDQTKPTISLIPVARAALLDFMFFKNWLKTSGLKFPSSENKREELVNDYLSIKELGKFEGKDSKNIAIDLRTPESEAFLRFFVRNSAKPTVMKNVIGSYLDLAEKIDTTTGSMFGEKETSPSDILNLALNPAQAAIRKRISEDPDQGTLFEMPKTPYVDMQEEVKYGKDKVEGKELLTNEQVKQKTEIAKQNPINTDRLRQTMVNMFDPNAPLQKATTEVIDSQGRTVTLAPHRAPQVFFDKQNNPFIRVAKGKVKYPFSINIPHENIPIIGAKFTKEGKLMSMTAIYNAEFDAKIKALEKTEKDPRISQFNKYYDKAISAAKHAARSMNIPAANIGDAINVGVSRLWDLISRDKIPLDKTDAFGWVYNAVRNHVLNKIRSTNEIKRKGEMAIDDIEGQRDADGNIVPFTHTAVARESDKYTSIEELDKAIEPAIQSLSYENRLIMRVLIRGGFPARISTRQGLLVKAKIANDYKIALRKLEGAQEEFKDAFENLVGDVMFAKVRGKAKTNRSDRWKKDYLLAPLQKMFGSDMIVLEDFSDLSSLSPGMQMALNGYIGSFSKNKTDEIAGIHVGGKVFVNLAAVNSPEDARAIAMHEILHKGVFHKGNKFIQDVADLVANPKFIYGSARAWDIAKAVNWQYFEGKFNIDTATPEEKIIFTHEFIAIAAEKRTSMPGVWAKIRNEIRKIMAKFGMEISSDRQLDMYIDEALSEAKRANKNKGESANAQARKKTSSGSDMSRGSQRVIPPDPSGQYTEETLRDFKEKNNLSERDRKILSEVKANPQFETSAEFREIIDLYDVHGLGRQVHAITYPSSEVGGFVLNNHAFINTMVERDMFEMPVILSSKHELTHILSWDKRMAGREVQYIIEQVDENSEIFKKWKDYLKMKRIASGSNPLTDDYMIAEEALANIAGSRTNFEWLGTHNFDDMFPPGTRAKLESLLTNGIGMQPQAAKRQADTGESLFGQEEAQDDSIFPKSPGEAERYPEELMDAENPFLTKDFSAKDFNLFDLTPAERKKMEYYDSLYAQREQKTKEEAAKKKALEEMGDLQFAFRKRNPITVPEGLEHDMTKSRLEAEIEKVQKGQRTLAIPYLGDITPEMVDDYMESLQHMPAPTKETVAEWDEKADKELAMPGAVAAFIGDVISGHMNIANPVVMRKYLKVQSTLATSEDKSLKRLGSIMTSIYHDMRTQVARVMVAGITKFATPAERNLHYLNAQMMRMFPHDFDKFIQLRKEYKDNPKRLEYEMQKLENPKGMERIRKHLRSLGLPENPSEMTKKQLENQMLVDQIDKIIKLHKSEYGDVFMEYYRNMILSAIKTWAPLGGNMMSNLLHTMERELVKTPTEKTIGTLMKLAGMEGNYKSWNDTNLRYTLVPVLKAFPQALFNAYTSYLAEKPVMEGDKIEGNVAIHGFNLPGAKGTMAARIKENPNRRERLRGMMPVDMGEAFRFPQRALLSGDEFFKLPLYVSSLSGQIYRDLVAEGMKPNTPAFDAEFDKRMEKSPFDSKEGLRALEYAKNTLFQSDNSISEWVIKARSHGHWAVRWPLRLTVPFIKTPTNVVSEGLKQSVGSPILLAEKAIRGKYRGKENRQELQSDTANLLMAAGWATILYQFLKDDPEERRRKRLAGESNITFTGSRKQANEGEKQAEYRTLPPMSIIYSDGDGNNYSFSYAPIEPFATKFAALIDLMNQSSSKDQSGTAWGKAFNNWLRGTIKDKTFVQGIDRLWSAISETEGWSDRTTKLITDQASALSIPNVVRTGVRNMDDNYRDPLQDKSLSFGENLKNKYLYTSFPSEKNAERIGVFPKLDIWGNDIQKNTVGESKGMRWLLRTATPVEIRKMKDANKYDYLMNDFNEKVPAEYEKWIKAMTSAELTIDGEDFKMPAEVGYYFQKLRGQRALKNLEDMQKGVLDGKPLLKADKYKQMRRTAWKPNFQDPTYEDMDYMQKAFTAAATWAKKETYRKYKNRLKKKYKNVYLPD